ncbi:RHS repeat-associated core domain-containing protein [Variovorax guangxiensis]|uniref:RHS repeat-associated protein n=1 Tax=Variovorax guangxiensis TaxID=1775474 RepID=A0A840FNP3_9BURK|nr:RHS repeat-associated core domain-containing protein [Variovorax guangxiensis]MBB4220910.1 RHS repeat-associated protein [Variovorax guangxiensis]
MTERVRNGWRTVFAWDGFNRMTAATDHSGIATTFSYDALGRRLSKSSGDTTTLFGWDGDVLAFESTQSSSAIEEGGEHGWSVHYIHEPNSFVPLMQVRRASAMALSETTDAKALMEANGGVYDIEQDPLWNGEQRQVPRAFDRKEMAFYQCDHLGTPQELTDHEGSVAWSAQYKAWGEAREAISEAGRRAGLRNPIRFQGQYWDEETGLHYNRYRYYDPHSGRYVSSDPAGFNGGINLNRYAPNPIGWIDPLGLTKLPLFRGMKKGGDGLPVVEPSARGLGARIPADIPIDEDGNVHPNTGGISVAPRTARNLPAHRRPPALGGTGKDEVWQLDESDLGPDLKYVQDCDSHGTIQPSRKMSAQEYQNALAKTQGKWRN